MNTGKLNKILVIQTAFIGDAILATSVLEKLHQHYPSAQIDYMVRKGNESLFTGHPFVHNLLVWDKKNGKYKNLLVLLKSIRKEKYNLVVNLQRFAASGFLTAFSGAKQTIGFKKNPFSFLFSSRVEHEYDNRHETERNHQLVSAFTDSVPEKPRLYPTDADFTKVYPYKSAPYVCIAPASVWFTKQFPVEKWAKFLNRIGQNVTVYLLGAPSDKELCREIVNRVTNPTIRLHILAGELSLLQTTALMKDAAMNYTNDSAPLHLASSINAPVRAVFCSTVPEFGFGPLSDNSAVIQTD
ncbi:MAG TPA: glycosyltransferase family 9 protein, partial [Bacteroidia bacterium]|nr:glycosyltransferase family 9 protein [Bacteroidia bacterium]